MGGRTSSKVVVAVDPRVAKRAKAALARVKPMDQIAPENRSMAQRIIDGFKSLAGDSVAGADSVTITTGTRSRKPRKP